MNVEWWSYRADRGDRDRKKARKGGLRTKGQSISKKGKSSTEWNPAGQWTEMRLKEKKRGHCQ